MKTTTRPVMTITEAASVKAEHLKSVSVSFHADAMVQVCIWHDLHLLASVVMTPMAAGQLADAIDAAARGRITRTQHPTSRPLSRTENPDHAR